SRSTPNRFRPCKCWCICPKFFLELLSSPTDSDRHHHQFHEHSLATPPNDNSHDLRIADSEASPIQSLCNIGFFKLVASNLNSALLHNMAHLINALRPGAFLSYEALT
ncbi:hypothetical protein BpHYR1_026480, partial [Brachionus plicatilis]